ncbi:cytochrome P450 [Sphingomonas sp.]|uniref:cytochrome P450 n=1 Tax=Sphingomonas sp. TaxID=28214 RepID=UPI003D6CDE98
MTQRVVPDHVPADLVFDFDYIQATHDVADPYQALMALDRNGYPDIFYSPLLGGHWVVRRYEDVFAIFRDHQGFTSYPIVIPEIQAQTERMIPIQIDPPDHKKYRRVLGPLFTPAATNRLEEIVRETAIDLIDPLVPLGGGDFVRDFAHRFPPTVFLRFMGMPTDRLEEFVGWASDSLVGTAEQQVAAGAKITEFVGRFVDEKYHAPGEDWASIMVQATEPDGTPMLTRAEIINISFFLFLAGLDTVLNSLAHAWRYLATHPEAQQRLSTDPDAIPGAVEEMLRLNTITNNSRRARHDLIFRNVEMRAGDPVLLLAAAANRDGGKFPDPERADLEREHNLHLSFGAGIHRCIGSNLARAEMRIAIEEWLRRIPSFSLRPGAEIRSIGGVTMGLQSLPLSWAYAA